MSKGKTLQRVLGGTSDASIRLDDLCQLLMGLGFEMRVRGGTISFASQESRKRSICNARGAMLSRTKCARYAP